MHRRIERLTRALDAPSLDLVDPVEIDKMYVSAGKPASATASRAGVSRQYMDMSCAAATNHRCSLFLTAELDSYT